MSSHSSAVVLTLRAHRALAVALAWTASALVPASSLAGGPGGLAPPGPCAEPREAVTGVAPGSGGDVLPPLAALLSPGDVAAPPAAAVRNAPGVGAAIRPGPCDRPGAGCGLLPEPTDEHPPITPGGRPGPAAKPSIQPGARPLSRQPVQIPVKVPGKRPGHLRGSSWKKSERAGHERARQP